MTASHRIGIVAVSVVGLGLASEARASNETHERTPVAWDGEAVCGADDGDVVCGLVLDRSNETSLHVPYGIPLEDTDVSMDEVIDSRRHQFFALCRQPPPALERPPNWVTDADVQAAGEVIVCTTPMDEGPEECAPLADPDSVDPEDVLETSSEWAGCWYRITADDMRRPITCEMAEPGVDWDVSGLPVGVYVVEGYTWEPALNLWSLRPGFVKVLDDPQSAEEDLPAAALLSVADAEDGIIYSGSSIEVEGCTDALDGSTLTAEWGALPNGPGDVTWEAFVVDQAVEDGAFVLDFDVPEEAEAEFIQIRVTVEDPMGRAWTAYLPGELGVLPGNDCPDEGGGGIVSDPDCPSGGDTTGDTGTDSGSSTSGGASSDSGSANDGGQTSGCGCAAIPSGHGAAGLVLLVLAGARRRRWTS
jgi:MYXO-CTERM domain-containing protein